MNHNPHYVFRPIKNSDKKQVSDLIKKANSGLSNLPKNLEETETLIDISTKSFKKIKKLHNRKFIFVIEKDRKKIVGISGIKARTGIERPFFSFIINDNVKYPYLELTKENYGPSEIGSLFLCPDHRKKGIGRLLSLSRFLYIRANPELFTSTLIAELRGYLHKNNVSPVWNALGKKFIQMSFNKADIESMKDQSFIPKYFPKKPIYLQLLPKDTIHYFKKVHPFTEPAKKLLLSENFKITNHIDIFDGGPKLESEISNIRTIKNALIIPFNKIEDHINPKFNYLVSNHNSINFNCTKITKKTDLKGVKQILNVTMNDPIFLVKERE